MTDYLITSYNEKLTASRARMEDAIGKATSIGSTGAAQAVGFSVFDQDYAAINSPQSPVPLVYSGGSVHLYRFGSRARICVQAGPSLVALQGGTIGSGASAPVLYWDPVNQFLTNDAGNKSVTSLTWSSTNGGQVAVAMGSALTVTPKVGDPVSISGVSGNTGTGDIGLINGLQYINTVTSSSAFTFLLPGTSAVWGTISGSIVVATNLTLTGLVKLLDLSVGNSMVVDYSADTGFATWNRSGTVAVLEI